MTLYRETFRFSVPLSITEESFTRQYGPPVEDDNQNDATWSAHEGVIYRYALSVDRDTGLYTTRIETGLPYRALTAVVSILSLLTVLLVDIPSVHFILSMTCLAIGLVPAGPVIPWIPLKTVHIEYDVVLQERRITPSGILPVIAGFATMVLAFEGLLFRLQIAFFALLSVTVYSYKAGLLTKSVSAQFTIVALPLVSLLPLLVTVGNLYVLGLLTRISSSVSGIVIGGLCALTVLFLWVFSVSCVRGVEAIDTISIQPLRSPIVRFVWLTLYFGMTIWLFAILAVVTSTLLPIGIELPFGLVSSLPVIAALARPVSGAPELLQFLWIGASLSLLVSPMILLAVTWLSYTSSTLYSQIRLFRTMTRVTTDELGFDPGVAVYSVPSSVPFANAIQFPGVESGILLSSKTVELLETDELEAVCAHELYHLEQNDSRALLLAMLAGLVFGGRNVLLAFYDLPQMEANADSYAAQTVGLEPTIRALRRLESHSQPAGRPKQGSLAFAGFQLRSTNYNIPLSTSNISSHVRSLIRRWLSAHEQLFYGDALMTAAHRSVDERIRTLAEDE